MHARRLRTPRDSFGRSRESTLFGSLATLIMAFVTFASLTITDPGEGIPEERLAEALETTEKDDE